jgi:hypothetical protein
MCKGMGPCWPIVPKWWSSCDTSNLFEWEMMNDLFDLMTHLMLHVVKKLNICKLVHIIDRCIWLNEQCGHSKNMFVIVQCQFRWKMGICWMKPLGSWLNTCNNSNMYKNIANGMHMKCHMSLWWNVWMGWY